MLGLESIKYETKQGSSSTPSLSTIILGFYENVSDYSPIVSIRIGTELAAEDRLAIELLRTDTDTFQSLIEARRYRAEEWFVDPAERIGLCNVPLPTRSLN